MAIKVKSAYVDTDTLPTAYVNTNSANLAAVTTAQQRTDLETALGDAGTGLVARVIHISGNYVKVKWYKDGKPVGVYKARGHNLSKATEALEYFKSNSLATPTSAATSLAITGTQSGAAASTSQFTATLTLANATTSDVSAKAYWTTSDATKATVSVSGLVTRVATGSATITAAYGGVSNTRGVTVT